MVTFLRSQASSLIASAIDFLLTITLVELFGLWYGTAHVLGNVAGAVSNFIIGRFWTFHAANKSPAPQIWKYALVWIGYVGISLLLLIALRDGFSIDYRLAKIAIAIVLSVTYNYQLQRNFVFK